MCASKLPKRTSYWYIIRFGYIDQVVTHRTQNAETRSFRSFYFTAASLEMRHHMMENNTANGLDDNM